MKQIQLLLIITSFLLNAKLVAQTNTFPTSGNVGIGTLNPEQKLDITGNLRLNSRSTQLSGNIDVLEFAKSHEFGYNWGRYVQGNITSYTANGYAGGLKIYTGYHIGNGNYDIKPAMTIGATGYNINDAYVGIGTVEPSSKLHVFGGDFLVNGGQGDRNSGIRIVAPVATSHYNWMIGANQNVNATFEITPSTVVNGTTFSVPAIAINANGNIGVGTNSPVPIGGACRTLGVNSTTDSYSGGISYMANGMVKGFSYYDNGAMALQGAAGVPVKIITNNTEQVRVDVSGYMGLGTANPTERLTVNGNIKTKKIIVTQTGWADYVFKDDYKLKPLQEVASYIKENKRLPEVPSAKEAAEKGASLGDTQVLLLKKIEELTLYVISLQNQVNELKKKTSSK